MKNLMSVLIILMLLPALVGAQTLKIEAMRPQFEFANQQMVGGKTISSKPSLFTTAWFITLSVPLYKRINVIGQLPFAFGKLEDSSVPTKDETLGNPAIGLRFDHERLTIDVTARLPLAKNGFAGFMAAMADIDRQEAFIPDVLPIVGMIKSKIDITKFSVVPYAGVSLNYKFEHEAGKFDFFKNIYKVRENDGEMYVLYGAEGWLQFGLFHLGAAYNARTWVTSGGTFSQSSVNQVSACAKLDFGKIVPGAVFRMPLDDILLDHVIGINCEFIL